MHNRLIIVGANAYSKVIVDTVFRQHIFEIVGIAADDYNIDTVYIDYYYSPLKIIAKIGDIENIKNIADFFVVAYEDNKLRATIYKKYNKILPSATIIDPSAVISNNSYIGEGSVILANSIIATDVKIGIDVIIKPLSYIDHNSIIDNHCHIAAGTIIGNNVEIKSYRNTFPGDNISTTIH